MGCWCQVLDNVKTNGSISREYTHFPGSNSQKSHSSLLLRQLNHSESIKTPVVVATATTLLSTWRREIRLWWSDCSSLFTESGFSLTMWQDVEMAGQWVSWMNNSLWISGIMSIVYTCQMFFQGYWSEGVYLLCAVRSFKILRTVALLGPLSTRFSKQEDNTISCHSLFPGGSSYRSTSCQVSHIATILCMELPGKMLEGEGICSDLWSLT